MQIKDNPHFPKYCFFLDMLEANGITDMDGAIHLISEIGHRGVSSIRGIGEKSTSDFFNKWLKAVSYYIKTKENNASIEERLIRLESELSLLRGTAITGNNPMPVPHYGTFM